MASKADVQAVATELPAMPLTLEGYSVLHQMFRFRWTEWRKLDEARQSEIARRSGESLRGQRSMPGSSRPIRCWVTRAT